MVQPTGTEGVQIIKMSNEKAKGGERIKIGPQAGDQTYDAFMTRVYWYRHFYIYPPTTDSSC